MMVVNGATGDVARHVASQLPRTGAALRASILNSGSPGLPGDGVRSGDLSVPKTLAACPDGSEAVSLDWPFPTIEATPAFPGAGTKHVRRIFYLLKEGVGSEPGQQFDATNARTFAGQAA